MPKLSKSRIINLNYNDGKRTIYNEVFDYGEGKDTLFSMENGIGKTVLIQFFMQPFIRNKRELAGRRFEDYFTSNAPTYIMQEVLLDNGEKLLLGMIIKKDNSEEERNKLKILAFINKYSKPNDFDIINIPFVDGKRILKFSEAEEKIKNYSRGKLNFKYYNFNDSSKKTAYFDELKLYKLDYKEWEDIIRSINNDESGLSNLYDKHKTDEALVRNVIIPLIESKINGEKNIIESIRNNLSKYIESYKQSKEAFNEVDLLKAFMYGMLPVTELLKEGTLKEEARDNLYKKLSSIAVLCKEEFEKKCSEKIQCEEFTAELNKELTKVQYEEHSLNYYNYEVKEKEFDEKLEEVESDYNHKDSKHKELVKEKHIQECAEVYEDFNSTLGDLTQVRERIANYEKEDSEIAQNIKNYKFTLKKIYEEELKSLNEKEKELFNNDITFKDNIKENEERKKALDEELRKNIRAEENAKYSIINFEKTELNFKKKYKSFNLLKNPLLNEYALKELEKYSDFIEQNINLVLARQEQLGKEEAALRIEKEDIKSNIDTANNEINEHKIQLEKKKHYLELFKKDTAKLIEILTIKNLPLKVFLNKDKLKDILESEINKSVESINIEGAKLRELEDIITRYETGLIQLPKEVLTSFENKGIQFEYALNWLKNYKGSKEEKENLVKNNPFFPYGILLSSKDIDLLKNESMDVYTSVPIPIINRGDLNKQLKLDKNNDILTFENQEFLIAFNYLLIDDEERAALLSELKLEIKRLKEDIENIQDTIDRNKKYLLILADYKYVGNEDEALEADINKFEEAIVKFEILLKDYKELELKNENRKDAINKELHELEKKLRDFKEQKDKFSEFICEHEEFKQYNVVLSDLKKSMEALKKKREKLEEEGSQLQASLTEITIDIRELKKNIKETYIKLELYKNSDTGVLQEEDKNIIEAKLQACEKELGDNIKRDKEDEKKLTESLKKIEDRLNRKVRDGGLCEEYKSTAFSEQRLYKIKDEISALEIIIKEIEAKAKSLDKELTVTIAKKQRELEDIEKLGFDTPIPKEDIKDSNFKIREKKIKEDIRQNLEIIKEYINIIDKLKLLKQKLDAYRNYSIDKKEIDFNFNNLEAAIKGIDEYIKQYDEVKRAVYDIETKISRKVSTIYDNYRDKNRFIKERLFDYSNKERKISSGSDIESLLEVVDRKVGFLELGLSHIKSEEEAVINEVLRYAKHLLQELKTIDKKSSIKHLGKTQKLLEINIPEEKEEEALKEYIRDKVVYYGSFEGDYSNLLEGDIQSSELLSKLMGNINRIRVDIKKIEKSGLVRKSWKDVLSQNSGGEKFVSMFILLSSLMSYMRKRETDIDNREEKKILIMDNPFAKTNAEHLLEPMFQIAEKYNIQLLCFSGIGGSSVYNRFNKIYVAKVIEDKFRNKENVSFKAGSEETLELSDFTISKEQITMF